MRTLHLLRHAKSDWSDRTLADHDRPLSARGKRARTLIADHVTGWTVDAVVCSTARRTVDTAETVVEALGCTVYYDDAIYAASARGLLAVVQELPDAYAAVMLIGHNPGIEDLTEFLCDDSPRYPSAALGTIELAIDRWATASSGCGTLSAFVTPKQLKATR